MRSFQELFQLDPLSRPEIFNSVYADADLSSATYWLGILLSAGIATFGLVENSPAVIIGAMIISPLMGPIMAAGLGLAAGDLYLAMKALIKLFVSILLAVGLSALLVWVLPFHSTTNEILSRTNPTLLDLGIALLSGIAGSVAVNRAGGGDGTTTLPGVAIAVALMPPLCTVGFGVGSGWNGSIMGGAGLLFLTNLVAIVFSAFVLFLLAGMNTTKVRQGLMELRAWEGLAQRLARGKSRRFFEEGAQLRWRALLLIALLAAIAFPLQKALRQLETEAVARDAAQQAVKALVPIAALVSQQTVVAKGSIAVRVLSTQDIPEAKIHAAEQQIHQRSGWDADVTVQSVASQSELARLMQRLDAASAVATKPVAAPKPLKTAEEIRTDLLARVNTAMQHVWPNDAPLVDFSVTVAETGTQINARYQAEKPLTTIDIDLLTVSLRDALKDASLTLRAQRLTRAQTKALLLKHTDTAAKL